MEESVLHGKSRFLGMQFQISRASDERGDAGIGLRSVARIYNLDLIPLQDERYDLVIPTQLLAKHSTLSIFLDTIVSGVFRSEIDALGGYDTRETGTIRELKEQRARS